MVMRRLKLPSEVSWWSFSRPSHNSPEENSLSNQFLSNHSKSFWAGICSIACYDRNLKHFWTVFLVNKKVMMWVNSYLLIESLLCIRQKFCQNSLKDFQHLSGSTSPHPKGLNKCFCKLSDNIKWNPCVSGLPCILYSQIQCCQFNLVVARYHADLKNPDFVYYLLLEEKAGQAGGWWRCLRRKEKKVGRGNSDEETQGQTYCSLCEGFVSANLSSPESLLLSRCYQELSQINITVNDYTHQARYYPLYLGKTSPAIYMHHTFWDWPHIF